MTLTDKNLVQERNGGIAGTQRIYRVGEYGLSLVNGPMLHSYPFAWEAAVTKYRGDDWSLTYETPLTSDVEVFGTDREANAFIKRAFEWFEEQKATAEHAGI
jgi:hypothetical protein